jgi:hypothetical protein
MHDITNGMWGMGGGMGLFWLLLLVVLILGIAALVKYFGGKSGK